MIAKVAFHYSAMAMKNKIIIIGIFFLMSSCVIEKTTINNYYYYQVPKPMPINDGIHFIAKDSIMLFKTGEISIINN